jgi:FkbM family methyltransferase
MVSRKTKSIYIGGNDLIEEKDYKILYNPTPLKQYTVAYSDGTRDVYKIYEMKEEKKYSIYAYNQPAIVSINEKDEAIQSTLKKGFYYEKHLIMIAAQFLKHEDVVLDIGANVGCVTIPLSKIVGNNGRIYSFEPFLKTRISLKYNIQANNLNNVILHKEAVGHKKMNTSLAKEITIHTSKDVKHVSQLPDGKPVTIDGKEFIEHKKPLDTKETNNYGAVQLGKGGPMVEMITIDSLDLKRVDLIKVDIEGSEPLMFYGAKNTIYRCRPIIIFEHNHVKLNDETIKIMGISKEVQNFNIVQFCKDLGYNKIIEIEGGGSYVLLPEGKERILNDDMVKWDKVDTIQGLKDFDVTGYTLYKCAKPKWETPDVEIRANTDLKTPSGKTQTVTGRITPSGKTQTVTDWKRQTRNLQTATSWRAPDIKIHR